jgi:hypothetical protein
VERTEIDGKPAFYVLQKTLNIPGLEPEKGIIRMQQLSAFLFTKEGNDLRCVFVQDVKMGGWFPDYMMSYLMSWMMNTNMTNF